jgi:tetratricopeptide (TPR) repeat protein
MNLWPFGGGTLMVAPPQPGDRVCMFAAVLAGPAMHVFLILMAAAIQMIFLILQGWAGVHTMDLFHWTSLFLFANLILLLGNLLPTRSGGGAGQLHTDGWQLLHLLFQKPAEETSRSQAYFMMESREASERNDENSALRWIERGMAAHPDQPVLLLMRGIVFMKMRRFSEARDAFLALLSSEEAKDPYRKYILYNNVAYADVLLRNPDLLPEADRYSGEAIRQIGWESSVIGTRGAVLMETGRVEEGIHLLQKALADNREDSGKASDAFHLAVAEQRRGNEAESRRYLALARKYDPHYYLLDSPGWELPAAPMPSR